MMNITFLIGNGFDLGLGLKTRYTDFYKYYLNIDNGDNKIQKFKQDIEKNLHTWADAELAFGKYTNSFTENTASELRKLYDDFLYNLSTYLRKQEDYLNVLESKEIISKSISNGILNFFDELRPVPKQTIIGLINNSTVKKYHFINFNYTRTLDRCIELATSSSSALPSVEGLKEDKIGTVIHIHGTVERDMIMGVNDESQIANKPILSSRKIMRTFIKPLACKEIKQGNVEKCNDDINGSTIICVYGMSLGDTDAIWWRNLAIWLHEIGERQVILYIHSSNYNGVLQANYADIEDDIQDRFFRHSNFSNEQIEKLRNRVHVVINCNLFGDKIAESNYINNYISEINMIKGTEKLLNFNKVYDEHIREGLPAK